jgi:hypothetical protein
MFANPFFHLKIGRLKATVHRVAMLKQGLQMRRILLYLGFLSNVGNLRNVWGDPWHIAAVTAQYAKRLEDRS